VPLYAAFADAAKGQGKKDAAIIGGATGGGAILGGTVNLSGLLAHKALAGDEDAQIQGVCEPRNGHSGALFGSS